MNSGALESLGQSPAAKRLKIPFPVGDLGRADPAGLQLSATAATCLSRPVGDLGSTVRPVHRRQRLREPSNAANGCGSRRIRAEGGGKRCASWTRQASSHQAGGPILADCAPLPGQEKGPRLRPQPLGQVQRTLVPWVRAQPWSQTFAYTACAQWPAVRFR